MKRFEDLEFHDHTITGGKQAILNFDNGYGVSVIFGNMFYSNGVDTYELAIMKDMEIDYTTGITDDVMGHMTKDEITKTMKEVQEL